MRKFTITFLGVVALAFAASAQSNSATHSEQTRTSQSSRTASQKNQSAQQGSPASASASASATSSTSASANTGSASASLDNGTAVNADLLTTIDARKVHPGQRVEAKTTKDVKEGKRVVMRRGTKLVGHVTEAQAHTKAHAESAVGIVFDQAIAKGGEAMPFHASIQALAAAQSMTNAGVGDDDMMAGGGAGAMGGGGAVRGGGGLVGGAAGGATGAVGSTAGMAGGAAGNVANAGRTAGGTLSSTTSAAGSVAGSASGAARGLDAAGNLTSSSSGVFGLNGLNLASSASSATEGSVITSANRNVHLSSGTQMLLKTNSQLGRDADQQGHSASQHSSANQKPNRSVKQ